MMGGTGEKAGNRLLTSSVYPYKELRGGGVSW